ncbi:MAG TPA: hypothetical protein VK509_14590 [Polyangiales bacterium]|nr:hypothetical protein [Polyangiales bacterium]
MLRRLHSTAVLPWLPWLPWLAALGLVACEYDLGDIPRLDGGGKITRPSMSDDEDAGEDDDDDAGTERDAGPLCSEDALRCEGNVVEICTDGAYAAQDECAETGCNPVTFACHACAAELSSQGVLSCAFARAEASGSPVLEIDNESREDADQGSCGGGGSPEAIVEWIAPENDYWQLDTVGSTYDTVLYARDCSCDGTELACNDDAAGSASAIVLHAQRGQRFAIGLDGKAGASGKAVLNARRVTCPVFDLDAASLPSEFVDREGDGSEPFRYVAPGAGFYSIRVTRSEPEAIGVCVHDGPRCEDPELGCNTSADGYGAEVIRELKAGQVVSLVVELAGEISGEPRFELDVHKVDATGCSAIPLDPQVPSWTIGTASTHQLTASCAPAGDARIENDMRPVGYPEARFTHTNQPHEICELYVSSSFEATVYLLRDGCGGTEAACAVSAMTGTSNPMLMHHTELDIPVSDEARDYVVVVEKRDSFTGTGTYEYNLSCIQ